MAGVGSKYAMPWIAEPGEYGKCRICKRYWGRGWWVRFGSKGVCHAECYFLPEFRWCTAERPKAPKSRKPATTQGPPSDGYFADRAKHFWSIPVTRSPPERPLPF
jgi:hypothetical protein